MKCFVYAISTEALGSQRNKGREVHRLRIKALEIENIRIQKRGEGIRESRAFVGHLDEDPWHFDIHGAIRNKLG